MIFFFEKEKTEGNDNGGDNGDSNSNDNVNIGGHFSPGACLESRPAHYRHDLLL